jgi:membrane-anchored glycerophosphoryl diester phosphodiesterase (GDPDase)
MGMSRPPPKALVTWISILVIAIVIFSLIVVIISMVSGSVPSWAIAILITSLIGLVIIRAIAMFSFGYPPYDSSRLFEQNREGEEKKK